MTTDASGRGVDGRTVTGTRAGPDGREDPYPQVTRERVRVATDGRPDEPRRWRIAVAAAGLAFASAFVVVVIAPDWATGATGGTLFRFQLLAVAVGVLVGVAGIAVTLRAGRREDPVTDTTPVERAVSSPLEDPPLVPGARLDAAVAAAAGADERARERVRESLRGVAIRVLVRRSGCSRAAAADLLASGEWTDDARAAAFLGDETVGLPLTTRIADWARGEPFRRRVDATVAELRRRWEGQP